MIYMCLNPEPERFSISGSFSLMRDLEISACPHDWILYLLWSGACLTVVTWLGSVGECSTNRVKLKNEIKWHKRHYCHCWFPSHIFHIHHINTILLVRFRAQVNASVVEAEWTCLAESTVDLEAVGLSYILHTCQSCNTSHTIWWKGNSVCVISAEDKWRWKCGFWP